MVLKIRNPFVFKKDTIPKEPVFDYTKLLREQIKQQQKALELEQMRDFLAEQREEARARRLERMEEMGGYFEDDADTPEDLLMQGLKTLLPRLNSPLGVNPAAAANTISAPETATAAELSPEQIAQLYETIPPAIKKRLPTFTDETIKKLAREQLPNISERSVENILQFIKQKHNT